MNNEVFIITGASTGIGYELARECAAGGHDLVIVARSEERLQTVARELAERYGRRVEARTCDLACPDELEKLCSWLEVQEFKITGLINNAGFGLSGPFSAQDPKRVLAMLQTNMVSLTLLTRRVLPGMLERKHGRILNIGSLAGFLPGPWMACYYASKAYVNSFSEALAEELRGSGVTVSCLCPGPTRTPFIDKAGISGSVLFSTLPMKPASVARTGYRAMMNGRPLMIAGVRNFLTAQSLRYSPRFAVRRISALLNRV